MSKIRLAFVFSVLSILFGIVNVLIQVDSLVSSSNKLNQCPADTSELIFMGEDESTCYYRHDLPHSNGFEVIEIEK